jgi:hypothetical protein
VRRNLLIPGHHPHTFGRLQRGGPVYDCPSSTTVVDRRWAGAIRAFDSDNAKRGTDGVFSISTSGEDAQRRTILARAGVRADGVFRGR